MKCNIPKASNRVKPIPVTCCKCGKVIRNLNAVDMLMLANKNYIERLKNEMCIDCAEAEIEKNKIKG